MMPIPSQSKTSAGDYAVFPGIVMFVFIMAWIGIKGGLPLALAIMISIIIGRIFILYLEIKMPEDPNVYFYKDRDAPHDIVFLIVRLMTSKTVNTFIIAIVMSIGIFDEFEIWPEHFSLLSQILLYYLVYTFLQYWEHRSDHEFRFLWYFHSIHHSPSKLHLFKADRHHLFSNMVKYYVFVMVPLLLIDAPEQIFLWVAAYEITASELKHSNVRQRFHDFFHFILPTAQLHRIHHSTNVAQGNSNYGNFPIWDIIFGTYTNGNTKVIAYGVSDEKIPQNFFSAHVYPFKKIYKDVTSILLKRG